MNIAFFVLRNVFFKYFGPIIDEALKNGHNVFCLHDYSQSKTGLKGYQFPFIEQTPKFLNGKVISLLFQNKQELINEILQNNIRTVVSLDFASVDVDLRKKLKDKGVFWVSLQSNFDIGIYSGEYLNVPDRFFIFSDDWLRGTFNYLKKVGKTKENSFPDFAKSLREKVKAVGFWVTDQRNIVNPEKVRQEWGIPPGKKVVLLFPFPFGSSIDRFWMPFIYGMNNPFVQLPLALVSFRPRFIKQVLRRENDIRVVEAIRKFCDKNKAYLLVKSRRKDPVRNYLAKLADKVLYDEEYYPATVIKCFSVADIHFSFYSTGAIEAISMEVPNVCIAPEAQDWKDIRSVGFKAVSEEGDLFNWPGVSFLLTIPEIIKGLPQKTFSDFSLNSRQQSQYLQKFVSGSGHSVSRDIILEIEKMTKGE